MEFNWQALYNRIRHCLTLTWPQGVKWKLRCLTVHLQDMSNHILEFQLCTPENVDVVQVTNLKCSSDRKKICRFSTLIWPFGIKRKFLNIISYLQDASNHILDYHLSECRQSSGGSIFTRNVIICHLIDLWPKNVIFKILLLICRRSALRI